MITELKELVQVRLSRGLLIPRARPLETAGSRASLQLAPYSVDSELPGYLPAKPGRVPWSDTRGQAANRSALTAAKFVRPMISIGKEILLQLDPRLRLGVIMGAT